MKYPSPARYPDGARPPSINLREPVTFPSDIAILLCKSLATLPP
jgi:hypothetical protein